MWMTAPGTLLPGQPAKTGERTTKESIKPAWNALSCKVSHFCCSPFSILLNAILFSERHAFSLIEMRAGAKLALPPMARGLVELSVEGWILIADAGTTELFSVLLGISHSSLEKSRLGFPERLHQEDDTNIRLWVVTLSSPTEPDEKGLVLSTSFLGFFRGGGQKSPV